MTLVANARMYAITPASAAAWAQLFAWVAEASGPPLDVIAHAFPAPLNDLWTRPDLGAAFICGYPYALGGKRQQLLAAPVPSPARYAGRPRSDEHTPELQPLKPPPDAVIPHKQK